MRAELIRSLDDVIHGKEVCSASITTGGELLLLLVDSGDVAKVVPKTARSSDETYDAEVVTVARDRHTSVFLVGLRTSFPYVQCLPDGETLLVGARCTRHESGEAEKNASVYGPDGSFRREFTLGDGIEDVRATRSGGIWVSYFDEGSTET